MSAYRERHRTPISADMAINLAADLDPVQGRAEPAEWQAAVDAGHHDDLVALTRRALDVDIVTTVPTT